MKKNVLVFLVSALFSIFVAQAIASISTNNLEMHVGDFLNSDTISSLSSVVILTEPLWYLA